MENKIKDETQNIEAINKSTINKSFAKIQQEISVKKKPGANVKYAYRNAEDIFLAAKAASTKTDWIFKCSDEIQEIAGRVFLKAVATAENKDEKHEAYAFVEVGEPPKSNSGYQTMSLPQWWGACSSYARKYALQGLLGLSEEDADSVADSSNNKVNNEKQVIISRIKKAEKIEALAEIWKNLNIEQKSDIEIVRAKDRRKLDLGEDY